jgi:chemotaxis-related protein WspD
MSKAQNEPEGQIFDTGAPLRIDACWNRIGVYGDRSCPVLAEHVHCRNCPVLLDGVRLLAELPAPPFYNFTRRQEEWAAHYALKVSVRADDDKALAAVMLFRLSDEWLALPVEITQEIVETRALRSLPHRRGELVLGVINLRGELVICVSLARLLGIGTAGPRGAGKRASGRMIFPRMMVIGTPERRIAFPVDEVHGIHQFHRSDQAVLPATVTRAPRSFCRVTLAWNGHLVGALDAVAVMRAIDAGVA